MRRRRACTLAVVLISASSCGSDDSPLSRPSGGGSDGSLAGALHFVDVAAELGLTVANVCGSAENRFIIESLGSGAAWLDYDADGDLDLYVVNGSRLEARGDDPAAPANQLWRNAAGESFSDVAASMGVDDTRWGIGCAVGDVDGDGDPDLYVSNFASNALFRNDGLRFTERAAAAGVADERMSTSCAFGDPDLDGDLDLYVANYLEFDRANPPNGGRPCHWHAQPVYCGPEGLTPQADALFANDGSGTFADVSEASGIAAERGFGLGVVFGDYDMDGDADLYVANDSSPNFLFRNGGDATFEDVAIALGAGHSEDGQEQAGMGLEMADYDNDGDQDIFVTNFSDDYNTLYENEAGQFFRDVSAFAGLVHTSVYNLGWGTNFVDFDNDGFSDLFVANGHVYPQADDAEANTAYRQRNQIYRNVAGKLHEVTSHCGAGFELLESSRGTAVADYDGDGDVDVFIVNEGAPPSLLRNELKNDNHWVRIGLRGVRSNRDGLGALVRVSSQAGTQLREMRHSSSYASSQEPWLHFGLGRESRVPRIEVTWPSGQVDEYRDLPTRQVLRLTEGRKEPEVLGRGF